MRPSKIILFLMAALFLGTTYQAIGAPSKQGMHSGVVLTTIHSGGYIYLEVEEDGDKFWVAAPNADIKVGAQVNFADETWMQDFTSKTLNRTFDKILFVSNLTSSNSGVSSSPQQPSNENNAPGSYGIPKSKTAEPPISGSIAKAEGGYTVEELFSRKEELKGKVVKVRGKVVKVSRFIMGKNWVHIKDGTGMKDTSDITFTSETETAEVGSIVTAEGTLAVEKNFGGGYLYSVIVENATFSK